ncbi:hypothetical protein D3C85_1481370 [compost metagenome]
MALGVLHQLGWRVEAHRLAIQHGAEEGGRLVALEPGTRVDEKCETCCMAFRKAVLAEALDLPEDALRELQIVAALEHARHDAFVVSLQPTFSLPGGHGATQLIRFPS